MSNLAIYSSVTLLTSFPVARGDQQQPKEERATSLEEQVPITVLTTLTWPSEQFNMPTSNYCSTLQGLERVSITRVRNSLAKFESS